MRAVFLFICLCVKNIAAKVAVENDNTLVEILKMNLQRNNEDYVDTAIRHDTINSDVAGRRGLHIQLDYYDFNETGKLKNETEIKKTPLYQINISQHNDSNDKENKTVRSINTNKIVKKAWIKYKNKLNSEKLDATVTTKIANIATNNVNSLLRGRAAKKIYKVKSKKSILENTSYSTMEQEIARFKKKSDFSKLYRKNCELLDMAPAKGSKIRMRRERGRLCYRSVLLPEGPKYDIQGRQYRPAIVARGDSFEHTPEPKVVLPRCCNCCKKSVLGCE